MPKFKYQFQNIYKIKQKMEDQKKLELGLAITNLNHQLEILENLKKDLKRWEESFYKLNGRISASDLIKVNKGIQYFNEQIRSQNIVVEKAEQQVEKKRAELNKAVQERKTYERLKELAYEEYMKAENADEFKRLDEIVSYQYSK